MSARQQESREETIAGLNDRLRIKGDGGRIFVTKGISDLPSFDARLLMRTIAAYDQFDDGNDPYGERDFGAFKLFGVRLFWKIDYYDRNLEFGSRNPADPDVTVRVLTVMLEGEY